MGHNTRVVAFYEDKSEFKVEIHTLKEFATNFAIRYNLRIGIVTDKELIKEMKKIHNDYFKQDGSLS